MDQVVQIVGALLVLAAFAAVQLEWMRPHSLCYLGLNLAGSSILTYVALIGEQWGFLLLDGVWAVASAWSLAVTLRTAP